MLCFCVSTVYSNVCSCADQHQHCSWWILSDQTGCLDRTSLPTMISLSANSCWNRCMHMCVYILNSNSLRVRIWKSFILNYMTKCLTFLKRWVGFVVIYMESTHLSAQVTQLFHRKTSQTDWGTTFWICSSKLNSDVALTARWEIFSATLETA